MKSRTNNTVAQIERFVALGYSQSAGNCRVLLDALIQARTAASDEIASLRAERDGLIAALRTIVHMRPMGDVDKCASPRKLVERMETAALEGLMSHIALQHKDNTNG